MTRNTVVVIVTIIVFVVGLYGGVLQNRARRKAYKPGSSIFSLGFTLRALAKKETFYGVLFTIGMAAFVAGFIAMDKAGLLWTSLARRMLRTAKIKPRHDARAHPAGAISGLARKAGTSITATSGLARSHAQSEWAAWTCGDGPALPSRPTSRRNHWRVGSDFRPGRRDPNNRGGAGHLDARALGRREGLAGPLPDDALKIVARGADKRACLLMEISRSGRLVAFISKGGLA
jgi:hypothetical protein